MGKIKVVEFEQEFSKTKKVKINLNDIKKYIPSINLEYTEKKFEELDEQKRICEEQLSNNLICSKAVQEVIKEVFDPSLLIYKTMDLKIDLELLFPARVVWQSDKWVLHIDAFKIICEKYKLEATFYIWSYKNIPEKTDDIMIKTLYQGTDTRFKEIFNIGESAKDGAYIQPLGSILMKLRNLILEDYQTNQDTYINELYKKHTL